MSGETRCAGRVWRSGRYMPSQCDKKGSLEHEGRMWCKAHHPPTVALKMLARDQKWMAEREAKDAVRLHEKRELALKSAALDWLREQQPDVVREMEAKILEVVQ